MLKHLAEFFPSVWQRETDLFISVAHDLQAY